MGNFKIATLIYYNNKNNNNRMDPSSQFSLNESPDSPNANPEQLMAQSKPEEHEQIKCRFCLETSKPLMSVCACTGSIQYVHEQCMLDWIARKLEVSQFLEIPYCELCRERFQAKMKVGRRKLSCQLLIGKLRALDFKDIAQMISHLLLLILCVVTILEALNTIYFTFRPSSLASRPSSSSSSSKQTAASATTIDGKFLFTNIILELYGIYYFMTCLKSRQRLVEESMIQVVQIVLQPTLIRKY